MYRVQFCSNITEYILLHTAEWIIHSECKENCSNIVPSHGYLRDMQVQVGVDQEEIFWFLGHKECFGKG